MSKVREHAINLAREHALAEHSAAAETEQEEDFHGTYRRRKASRLLSRLAPGKTCAVKLLRDEAGEQYHWHSGTGEARWEEPDWVEVGAIGGRIGGRRAHRRAAGAQGRARGCGCGLDNRPTDNLALTPTAVLSV